MSKKKQLAQKIAEKEAARIKVPLTAEEALADKLEKQRLQEESDLKLTQESFGISDAGTAVTGSGLESVKLATKDDFEVFKKSLVNRLQLAEKSPHYVNFLDASFRDICASLEPDDIKRLSSSLNTLFNEKVKAQKVSLQTSRISVILHYYTILFRRAPKQRRERSKELSRWSAIPWITMATLVTTTSTNLFRCQLKTLGWC